MSTPTITMNEFAEKGARIVDRIKDDGTRDPHERDSYFDHIIMAVYLQGLKDGIGKSSLEEAVADKPFLLKARNDYMEVKLVDFFRRFGEFTGAPKIPNEELRSFKSEEEYFAKLATFENEYVKVAPLVKQFRSSGLNYHSFVTQFRTIWNQASEAIQKSEIFQHLYEVVDDKWLSEHLPVTKLTGKISKSVYSPERDNKNFVSFDVTQANVTAACYVFPTITGIGAPFTNWATFISGFTDNPIFANSKPFRQIILGKAFKYMTKHKVRMMTLLQRGYQYVIGQVADLCYQESGMANLEGVKVISYSHDEIVFQLPDDITGEFTKQLDTITSTMWKGSKYSWLKERVKEERFTLRAYSLSSGKLFYVKEGEGKKTLKGVSPDMYAEAYSILGK